MRLRRVLMFIVLVLALGGGAFVARPYLGRLQNGPAMPTQRGKYQCAMHPQIVSDVPGICPICRMKLQLVDEGALAPADPAVVRAGSAQRQPRFYRHPMRADVTSPVPGKDEMGMDYIPVYDEDLAGDASNVPGHAAFSLSADRQQLIGVRKAPVERRDLNMEIRAVGKVAYDPALFQAIVEYREALTAQHGLKDSPWPEAHDGAKAIVRASALRLRQMGIAEMQLKEIAEDGRNPLNLLLPGKSVWVYAQVYEYEVELVRPGQTVVITTPALPGRTYTAKVTSVDPIVNPMTRTARVRILLQTPDSNLRPETFLQIKIQVASEQQLAVPQDAVLHTGEQEIVFVVKGQGEFEPRAVQLGREAHGFYEVVSGLAEGDEVVTSANFLIDSESRFRAALASFSKKAASEQTH